MTEWFAALAIMNRKTVSVFALIIEMAAIIKYANIVSSKNANTAMVVSVMNVPVPCCVLTATRVFVEMIRVETILNAATYGTAVRYSAPTIVAARAVIVKVDAKMKMTPIYLDARSVYPFAMFAKYITYASLANALAFGPILR